MTRKAGVLWLCILALASLAGCGSGGTASDKGAAAMTISPKLAELAAGVQSQTYTATLSGGVLAKA